MYVVDSEQRYLKKTELYASKEFRVIVMKKIIINGRFLIHRVTGVERYAREILARLDEYIPHGSMEMAIPPETTDIPVFKNIIVVKVGRFHNMLWEHISFPIYVRKRNGISLNLCNVAPLLSPGIVCIHDVKVKATPQFFSKKFLLWYNILFFNATKRARKIITVSEFSKREIVKYYKTNPDKISIIPNAWQHFDRVDFDEKTLEKYALIKNGYYFSMCSLEPNKNFKWIAEVAKRSLDRCFAIAGSVNERVFKDGVGFECPPNMKLLGYVSDSEAKTLMRDCKAFLFPTFYEGFGIPPLEALSAGAKNVFVSNTEVMHEIFGESVSYINPREYILNDNDTLSVDANQILSKYSWEASAKMLYGVISEEAI